MPKPHFPASAGARVGWGGLLLVVGVAGFFALDQFVLTRFTEPERHADRTTCIGPYEATPAWRNTCGEALNFRYCLFAGVDREVCRSEKLEPDEGVTDVASALTELGGGLTGLSRMACAEPFSVMQKPHPNTGRLQDVCG